MCEHTDVDFDETPKTKPRNVDLAAVAVVDGYPDHGDDHDQDCCGEDTEYDALLAAGDAGVPQQEGWN